MTQTEANRLWRKYERYDKEGTIKTAKSFFLGIINQGVDPYSVEITHGMDFSEFVAEIAGAPSLHNCELCMESDGDCAEGGDENGNA